MKFNLIHPSRNRAIKSIHTTIKWQEMSSKNIEAEFYVSIDSDEPQMKEYECYPKLIINNNRSAVDAINNAAKIADGDIFIVISDDTEPIKDWDLKILKEVEGKTDWILKTQDGIQPWIITMPIMDRAYYNRFGYIYHPDYLHMFCDTELTCVADITGRKIKSNLMFPHKHYSVTKEQPDEVNNKADATWAQGEKLFLERYKRGFDLPVGDPIEDNGMVSWIKRKAR